MCHVTYECHRMTIENYRKPLPREYFLSFPPKNEIAKKIKNEKNPPVLSIALTIASEMLQKPVTCRFSIDTRFPVEKRWYTNREQNKKKETIHTR